MKRIECLTAFLLALTIESECQIDLRPPSSFGDVAFTVKKATEKLEAFAHVHFQDVLTNLGGGWNSQTSEFEAPVNGGYFFIFHAISDEGSDFTMALVKNKEYQVTAYGTTGFLKHGSNSAFLELRRGDIIALQLQQGKIYEPRHASYTTFTGFIVFQF
ncbi:complement C1q-like protein 4 [Panulirus ornatus]|uniref:complement C1q-like protein 4 n=1 Tax=Panulirus ornatus TaxID=150431 RepID=UPI003A897B4A